MRTFEKDFMELTKLTAGREIEIHWEPDCKIYSCRASVYVRGDGRDNYSTCVGAGHSAWIDVAIRRAGKDFRRNRK